VHPVRKAAINKLSELCRQGHRIDEPRGGLELAHQQALLFTQTECHPPSRSIRYTLSMGRTRRQRSSSHST
jgi:hypothetical protein